MNKIIAVIVIVFAFTLGTIFVTGSMAGLVFAEDGIAKIEKKCAKEKENLKPECELLDLYNSALAKIEELEGDPSTYDRSKFHSVACTKPGCSSSTGLTCDAGDIAMEVHSIGTILETVSGQTYTIFGSNVATERTLDDSWRYNFQYSGGDVGNQEGVRFSITCQIP